MLKPACWSLTVILCLASAWPAAAQCDATVKTDTADALSYRQRGSRCEGFYRAPSNASIDLVGLTRGVVSFSGTANEVLRLSARGIDSTPVHVRALGIPLRTYYRMDALLRPGETLEWPTELIARGKIPPSAIGVLGFVDAPDIRVYIPLSVTMAGATVSPDSAIRMYVRTLVDLEDVSYIYRANGVASATVQVQQPTRAGNAIVIALPQDLRGAVAVRVDGRLKGPKDRATDWVRETFAIVIK